MPEPDQPNNNNSKGIGLDTSENVESLPLIDKYYLFVIAIDNYEDSGVSNPPKTLNNPVLDASRITELLLSKYRFSRPAPEHTTALSEQSDKYQADTYQELALEYDTLETKCLYNENATYDNIEDHLRELQQNINENDALLILFSGHGVSQNEKAFILPFDAQTNRSRTWFEIDWMKSFFDNYTTKKKCRDLLIVLDCCFAGTAVLGLQATGTGKFSRYILTATGPEEVALDGLPGEGSPFAQVFWDQLHEITAERFSINGDHLKEAFELNNMGMGEQEIIYLPLPMKENGLGRFVFELKVTDRPPVKEFCDTLINYLDFREQRANLENAYDWEDPILKIITTFGSSIRAQKLLSKICFRWFFNAEGAGIPFSNKYHYWPQNLTALGVGDLADDIWLALVRQMQPTNQIDAEAKAKFINWILDRLKGNPQKGEKFHEIIHLSFTNASPEFLKGLEQFCITFRDALYKQLDERSAAERGNLGRLFLLLTDQRQETLEPHFSPALQNDYTIKFGAQLNFIATHKIQKIKKSHVRPWINRSRAQIKLDIMKQLKEEFFIPRDEPNFELKLEEFIAKAIEHCHVDPDELYNKLFGFDNKSF